ncbi:hypothetical protein VU05_00305 [Desulfobulbus sp. F1]|nr:hypothetical protein [Desulfobulbus sp. F1]
MIDITLKYNNFKKHRMPQYYKHGKCDIIPQEKERQIWLRIPVELSSDSYQISFFIQCNIEIKYISPFGDIEDVAYFIATSWFTNEISQVSYWNVLGMEEIHPLYNFDLELLSDDFSNKMPYRFDVQITPQLHEYLSETYSKIKKAVDTINLCKKNLGKMVQSSSSSGFQYIEYKITQYLNYLDNCVENMSTHSDKTCYFEKNLEKIKQGFGELIKRKQVKNSNYQYHLNETRTAIYKLPIPDVWDVSVPNPPDRLTPDSLDISV